jgi:uncharacterized protein YkwD
LEEVLELTNAYRADHGLAELRLNRSLSAAAQEYSERMAREGFFDHRSPDGDMPGERIAEQGYRWQTWGENIAMGYRTASQVMRAWINSPGHRANLLNPRFDEIGLGVARARPGADDEDCLYWSQEFGRRDGDPIRP